MCISSQFFLAPALPGKCGRFLLIILRIFHEVLINHCGCIQFLIANLIVQKYEVLCLKLSVTCLSIMVKNLQTLLLECPIQSVDTN